MQTQFSFFKSLQFIKEKFENLQVFAFKTHNISFSVVNWKQKVVKLFIRPQKSYNITTKLLLRSYSLSIKLKLEFIRMVLIYCTFFD